MYTRLVLFSFIIACNRADQSFSATNTDIIGDQGTISMEWSPSELVFMDMEPGFTYSGTIIVTSTGENVLQISKVDVTNSADGIFYTDTSSNTDITLGTDVSRDFIITAQINDNNAYIGEARIKGNDPSHRDVRIPLCAFPKDYQGDLACPPTYDNTSDTGDTAETPDTGGIDTGSN